MKALLYTIMIFGCLSLGAVCCKNPCFNDYPLFQLRVANKSDSSNLLFGSRRQFTFNKNLFFNKELLDSLLIRNIYVTTYYLPDPKIDSIILIYVPTGVNKFYFQLPNNPVDSFEFIFKKYAQKNCEDYYVIDQVKFDGNIIQQDNRNYYYNIYK